MLGEKNLQDCYCFCWLSPNVGAQICSYLISSNFKMNSNTYNLFSTVKVMVYMQAPVSIQQCYLFQNAHIGISFLVSAVVSRKPGQSLSVQLCVSVFKTSPISYINNYLDLGLILFSPHMIFKN